LNQACGSVGALAFFVGGQLMLVFAVAPAIRRHGTEEAMRAVAMRFGIGSGVALVVLAVTGVAMASHFSVWDSSALEAKLMVLVLVAVLTTLHVASPKSRALSYAVTASSLLVVWLGVKLTYG